MFHVLLVLPFRLVVCKLSNAHTSWDSCIMNPVDLSQAATATSILPVLLPLFSPVISFHTGAFKVHLFYHLFVSSSSVIVVTAAVADDFWGLSVLLPPLCLSQQPCAFLLVTAPQFSPVSQRGLALSHSQLSGPEGTHLNLGMCPSPTPASQICPLSRPQSLVQNEARDWTWADESLPRPFLRKTRKGGTLFPLDLLIWYKPEVSGALPCHLLRKLPWEWSPSKGRRSQEIKRKRPLTT